MNQVSLQRFPPDDFFAMERIEKMQETHFFDNHCNDFYEIIWFTDVNEGDGQWINGEYYKIIPNQVILLPPGQVYRMERGWKKGYVLAFSRDFFHSIVSISVEWFVKPFYFSTVVSDKTGKTIEKILYLVQEEYEESKRIELLRTYFSALIIHVQSLFPRQWNRNPHKMITLLSLIDQHFKQEREVGFYSKMMSLSVRRLNELSVETFGITVKQIIIEKLVVEAKKMIYIEPLSLKEIAYRLGFSDPAYFSRIFKKKTGYTPEEFRRRK